MKLDLADPPARRRMLAEIDARSKHALVMTEGVVPYLSVDEAAFLADDLRAMTCVRSWVVDYFSPETLRYRQRAGHARHLENAPFRFEPKDWHAFFEQHGWRAKETRYLTDEGDRLKRPFPMPLFWRALMMLRGSFLTREQRDAMRRFAGYVSLEPK